MKKRDLSISCVERILRFNAGRDQELLARKYRAMRVNAFVFLRASCHLFYDALPKSKLLRRAPLAWICGDLHLENFGSYKGDNRLVYFDLNDFDEASLAPCTWDLLRFLTSLLVGAETLKLKDTQARDLGREFLDAYVSAIRDGKAHWLERDTAQDMIKELLDRSRSRKRRTLLNEFTILDGDRRHLKQDGDRALPVTRAKRTQIERFMGRFAKRAPDPAFYRCLDVAKRVAGTGSLGIERYVVLVEGKGSPDGNYLLDVKQALPPSLRTRVTWKLPRWGSEAHRIVSLQKRLQAESIAFLAPVSIGNTAFVLRGLQPAEDRLSLRKCKGDYDELQPVIARMGQLAAWAQLRSSGREGSATTDELIEFWRDENHQHKLLSLALQCKAQVDQDYAAYREAYDGGDIRLVNPRPEHAKKR